MRTPVIDGRSIEQFIPANLRSMFYKNAIPQYKYAIHDGLDPYGFSTNGLVLYVPLWALKDSSFKSVDAYKHTATVTNATWQPDGRTFAGADWINCGNNSVLNFTSGAFTIIVIAETNDKTDNQRFFNRGVFGTGGAGEGYELFFSNGEIKFRTNQVGAAQDSLAAGAIAANNTWYHIAATRSGTTGTIYSAGVDVTTTPVAHTNPATSTKDARIGIYFNETEGEWIGTIGEVYIYDRALSAAELLYHKSKTLWRYQ